LHAQPRQQREKLVSDVKAKQIAEMNDRFRLNFYVPCFGPRAVPGHIVCTGQDQSRCRRDQHHAAKTKKEKNQLRTQIPAGHPTPETDV
jgi:hypothetical protein